jgi:hypothetical protein
MGNAQAGGLGQCAGCCESRTDVDGMQTTVVLSKPPAESANLYGVGLVFRTTRDGKMVVSSFVKDSSAYECGLVRDGGDAILLSTRHLGWLALGCGVSRGSEI